MKGPLDQNAEADQLDRLMDLSPLPEPDAWFTARTLARCRMSQPAARGSSFALGPFWVRWAAFGLVLIAGGVTLQQTHRIHSLHVHHQHRVQEAFEVMASMGKDKDSNDTSWQDSSL